MRKKIAALLMLFALPAAASRYISDAYYGGHSAPFTGDVIAKAGRQEFILQVDAADAYARLEDAASEAGFKLVLSSAYRTTKDQRRMVRQRRRWAAAVGHSMHQSGLAVDIAGTRIRCVGRRHRMCHSQLFNWLQKNAEQFGWYNTAPREPWHWAYLGIDKSQRAEAMNANARWHSACMR